jgi:hypothetical protein
VSLRLASRVFIVLLAERYYAESHYAKLCYDESRYAECQGTVNSNLMAILFEISSSLLDQG